MFTKSFWLATAERAARTFAQTLAALIVTGATGLFEVAWGNALPVAGLAAVAAVLTAVAYPSRVSDPTDEWLRVHPDDEHLLLGHATANELLDDSIGELQ